MDRIHAQQYSFHQNLEPIFIERSAQTNLWRTLPQKFDEIRLIASPLLEEETLFYRIDDDWTPLRARERRYGALMFALLLLLVMVLFVGVGLLINVYLYRHHALTTINARVSLDEQLFVYHGEVDATEIW